MEHNSEERKLAAANIITKCFGVVMVVLYVIFGTTIIFRAHRIPNIREGYAIAFGVLMILYGIFRGFKYYRKYF